MYMNGEGIGFGKAILFNEHFVVYGIPAIVSAIGKYTLAKVKPFYQQELKLEDKRYATPGYKEEKLEQQKDSLNRILMVLGINLSPEKGIEITLSGNLYAASGIGASAASCVAIARALSDYFNLNLSTLSAKRFVTVFNLSTALLNSIYSLRVTK